MKLLTPIALGPVELKNRVVSTAHAVSVDFFQPGTDGEKYMAYQERRAQGGTGLLIITAMHVHRSGLNHRHFLYEPLDISKKFAQLSTRVHRHGTRVISQLFHFGVQGKSNCRDDLTPLWGFSGTVSEEGEVSHEMTGAEIEEVIQSFVDTAVIAVENGIDGVELHGTHGYLLQQSFSPFANKRTDEWGKDLHFATTLAHRVREAIGPDAVMGLRISTDDFIRPQDGGLGHQRLCEIAAKLIGQGLFDYLNHSEGSGGAHYARAIGSYRYKFGEFLPLTRGLREAIGAAVPVIGVGKIPTTDLAEQALQDGDCDLVGMTRAQIADPDLVRKLQSGQGNRIRLCTGSNQGCIDRAVDYPITCFQNPETGYEWKLKPLAKVAAAKRVLVVGGGPAGMKAAELAARRGHLVTLAEASHRLGGRLNLVEHFGHAANLLASTSWLEQELQVLQVPVLTQTVVDEEFIEQFDPQAVIFASGSVPEVDLGIESDDSIPVLSSDAAAEGFYDGMKFDMQGTRSLFVDRRGNYETALVVESLARRGSKVTVVTPFLHFGANLGFTHLNDLLNLLPELGCELRASTVIEALRDGKAHCRHVFSKETSIEEFDFIVAGVNPRPNKGLYEVMATRVPVFLAGDVVAPRSALEAFHEGDRIGRTV